MGAVLDELAVPDPHQYRPHVVFHRNGEEYIDEKPAGAQSAAELTSISGLLFGRALTVEDLATAFRIDIPGYRLGRIDLEYLPDQGLAIRANIETADGEEVGASARLIPPRPQSGEEWIVRGNGIRIDHDDKGIGRQRTQSFLAFLRRLGVDALDLPVGKRGAYVFPHLGFDFIDAHDRDMMKIRLREHFLGQGVQFSTKELGEWALLQNAWELADMSLSNKLPIGRLFLLGMGRRYDEPFFHVRFRTDLDHQGWGRLFKDHHPVEWNSFETSVREYLIEYFRNVEGMPHVLQSLYSHVSALLAEYNNWLLPIPFYLEARDDVSTYIPDEMQGYHRRFVNAAHLIAWMAEQERRGNLLARAFWNRFPRHQTTVEITRDVVRGAEELLGMRIALPSLDLPEPDDSEGT